MFGWESRQFCCKKLGFYSIDDTKFDVELSILA